MIEGEDVGFAFLFGLFASIVAIVVTVVIEKWGGLLGGILGTTPTTILPASLGMAMAAHSPDDLKRAMFTVPAGMLLNSGFLYLWKILPNRLPTHYSFMMRLVLMSIITLSYWLFFAAIIVFVIIDQLVDKGGLPITALGVICFAIHITFGSIATCINPAPTPKGSNPVSYKVLLARGLFAGTAIFLSVLISHVNSVAAGFASTFPAIFLTTMVSLWWSQGESVTVGAVGPMILGGLSVSGYAMVYALSEKAAGMWIGIGVSYICVVSLISVPLVYILKNIQKKQRRKEAVKQLLQEKIQEELSMQRSISVDSELRPVELEEEN